MKNNYINKKELEAKKAEEERKAEEARMSTLPSWARGDY